MKKLLVSCALFLLSTSATYADIIYEIGFDQASYDVAVGAEKSVKVMFREIVDGAGSPKLAAGGLNGLFSAGFKLDYATTTGASGGATFKSFTLNTAADRFDPGFTTSVSNVPLRTFQLNTQARDITNGIEVSSFSDAGKSIFEIEIGTFVFQNDNLIDKVSTLSLVSSGVPFETIFADASEPASVRFSQVQFGSITAVPEPSSTALIAVALPAIAWLRRRYSKSCSDLAK
jgi:hypothetical protein